MSFSLKSPAFWLLIGGAMAAGCSKEVDNDLPRHDDAAMQQRLDSVEKDVAVVSENDRHREQGLRLSKETLGETSDYLARLYANINGTRAQDLPEWQEMYLVLTDDKALMTGGLPLGPRQLKTNFEKLSERADEQQRQHDGLKLTVEGVQRADAGRDRTLQTVLDRLDTIDRNIVGVNAAMEDKFKAVDKLLGDYEGRIKGMEDRVKTMEVNLDGFQREFTSLQQSVANINETLRRYDPATMHNDIKNLQKAVAQHDERIIDLTGKVQLNTSEITNTRNDLSDVERELSGVSSEVGTLKSAVAEIIVRLDNCNCTR